MASVRRSPRHHTVRGTKKHASPRRLGIGKRASPLASPRAGTKTLHKATEKQVAAAFARVQRKYNAPFASLADYNVLLAGIERSVTGLHKKDWEALHRLMVEMDIHSDNYEAGGVDIIDSVLMLVSDDYKESRIDQEIRMRQLQAILVVLGGLGMAAYAVYEYVAAAIREYQRR